VTDQPDLPHPPDRPVVTSFIVETNLGGLPITLCTCGLLIYQPMARTHMAVCAIYQQEVRHDQ
jgi:hypothetical protein